MTDPVRPLRPVQSASTALPQNDHQNVAGLIITAGTPLLTKRPTCSQCRIRKVRCDGQQSICGNCQRLRFECSFQQNTATVARSDYVLKVPEARRRMQACVPCHDKKTRCLGELPSCTNCLRKGRACVYPKIKKAPPASRSRDATEQQNTSNGRSPTGGTGDSAASSQGPATSQLDKNLTASLVEDYFRHLYPLPAFSFLHKPTLIQRCEDDTINEQLKLAICAITALHLQSSHLSHERWVNQAENSILQHIGQPSIFHLQSLFLIVRYRIESGGFPKAFMLAGLAARTAVALRLNYERRDLSYVAQEARRRLYWSLYLLDDYFCVGLREFELCPEETIHLQLPCPEEVFAAGGHSSTGFLHPGSSEPVESIGLHASYLRVTAARRANMRFIRRVGLGEESPATLRNSIQSLEQNLTSIHASMGDLGTYSATTLTSTQWQAEYLMLHISWHQCHCDLYRSFIDSYSEAAPVAVLEGLEPQDRAVLQRKCVEHAQTIIHILSDFFLHGNDLCQLERDVAVCAFEAARIVMFDCRRTGLAAMMEEALGKANLCLELIARHFGFSASTQPLWKEFTRLVENYTARKVIQEREEEGVANADSQPPSPRSTRLSQIATARQKLSVQSLLLQSDFVDDSADIVAPYGKVVSATPATIADSSSHLNVTKRKPSTSPFETSRDSAPPRSIPETAHLLMPGQEIAMGDLAATPGPPSWKVPAVPNGVGVMMDNFTGSAAPTVITPSSNSFFAAASAATVVTVGPSTLPVAMDTSSAAPAEPGFDQGFVFNPWMGLSGNEDLRVYSELAVGSNEEY